MDTFYTAIVSPPIQIYQHSSTASALPDAYGILYTNLSFMQIIFKTSVHVQTAVKYLYYSYVSTV